jgi:histidinol-phosphate aminotransferase
VTVEPRPDVALMEGYHSPRIDVTVRLNVNEAPGPPPAAFGARLADELARIEWHRYPDRAYTALRSHIADLTGTGVAVGERAADLSLDVDEVRSALAEVAPEITFLCSPNNPTGMIEPEEVVRTVADEAPGLVVVDEAYGQFAPWSALELVDGQRPLAVTRTFSKTWSMAAARLGYLVGPAWLVEQLDKVVLPYHLDAFKQAAGVAALAFVDDMQARVAHIVEERGRVTAALADLPVEVWPSAANFILFRPRDKAGDEVWKGLVERSVLVRSCTSWPRLDGCLRVTIGTPDEDDTFLGALREVLA